MKKSREELIDDFLRDTEVLDFKCSPIFAMGEEETLSVKIYSEDEKPILDISFLGRDRPVHIFDLGDSNTRELDQYSWLFSRVSELLFLLEKANQ